jgi:hypothetical protein
MRGADALPLSPCNANSIFTVECGAAQVDIVCSEPLHDLGADLGERGFGYHCMFNSDLDLLSFMEMECRLVEKLLVFFFDAGKRVRSPTFLAVEFSAVSKSQMV